MSTPPPIQPPIPPSPNARRLPPDSSLGIGSVVLGIVGICTISLAFVSLPLLGIGLVLGVLGIKSAIKNKTGSIGFAIAGTAICGVLIIYVAIVSLSLAIFSTLRNIAYIRHAKAQIEAFQVPMSQYVIDMGRVPSRLDTLVETPFHDTKRWRGPYLTDAIPIDPWGMSYQYNPDTQRIWSFGPDRIDGTRDDIVKQFSFESDDEFL